MRDFPFQHIAMCIAVYCSALHTLLKKSVMTYKKSVIAAPALCFPLIYVWAPPLTWGILRFRFYGQELLLCAVQQYTFSQTDYSHTKVPVNANATAKCSNDKNLFHTFFAWFWNQSTIFSKAHFTHYGAIMWVSHIMALYMKYCWERI